jgi:hypothetical protein
MQAMELVYISEHVCKGFLFPLFLSEESVSQRYTNLKYGYKNKIY